MRGPTEQSANPPAPRRATTPAGPADEEYVYHLTPAAQLILAEHERATGACSTAPQSAQPRSPRPRRARRSGGGGGFCAAGRGAAGGGWGRSPIAGAADEGRPLLRLSGDWLARTGFPIGQEFEIAIEEGRLILETV